MNIAIFASGQGSNFSAIVKARKAGKFRANISLLVCDNPNAAVINKAKKYGVKIFLIQEKEFSGKTGFDNVVLKRLLQDKIDLVVMAGYMRVLGSVFVKAFKNRILNIHPTLLPAFKGAHGIEDALKYGVKVTGVTVHFVDEKVDHGPIILQQAVEVKKQDTPESLARRIHKIEHQLYPEVIRLFIKGKLEIKGRVVFVT